MNIARPAHWQPGVGESVPSKAMPVLLSRGKMKPETQDRYEVRFAGRGGQGIILIGMLLARAAAIYEGKNAAQAQSYGPEARGGACRSEVVIATGEIDYPRVLKADLLLAMTQEACDRYFPDLKPGGVLVVDSVNVTRVPTQGAYVVPLTAIAEEATGRTITASMVGLGVAVGLSKVVSRQAIEAAVATGVPQGTEEINLKALRAGLEKAEELRRERE